MEYSSVVWSPFIDTKLGESERFVTGDDGFKSNVIGMLDGNPWNLSVKSNKSSSIILHNEATTFLCQ